MSKKEIKTNTDHTNYNNLGNALAKAMQIDDSQFFKTITKEDGTEVEISQKIYELANPNGNRKQVTIYDLSIIESIEKIKAGNRGKAVLGYMQCKELAKIAEKDIEKMGFKNIADFAFSVFDYARSTANLYVQIGKAFVNDDYTLRDGLPQLSIGALQELLPLVDKDNGSLDKVIGAYIDGTLVDGMTTKKLREVVKAIANGTLLEDKTEEVTETEEKATEEKVAEESKITDNIPQHQIQELESNFDKQVACGSILARCDDIKLLFDIINKHGVEVIGYEEFIDSLKALARTLMM